MAESTLSITYTELKKEVAHYLGYTRSESLWDAQMLADVQQAILQGYRWFLYPPPISEKSSQHEWSFLRKSGSLALSASDYDYDLPDDFAGMASALRRAADKDQPEIARVHESTIHALRAQKTHEDTPLYFAVAISAQPTASASQRYEALLYPTPDASETVTYRYIVAPPKLTDASPYPLGGAAHSETILAACLAAAEQLKMDEHAQKYQRFRELLAASVRVDRERVARDDESQTWDVNPESTTLDLTYTDLQRQVGNVLDFGFNPASWTHHQRRLVSYIIQNGYRQFITPPPISEQGGSHRWNFLNHHKEEVTVANQWVYPLPEDFASFVGRIHNTGSSNIYQDIVIVSENDIHEMRAEITGSSTSWPLYAAMRVRQEVQEPERYEMLLHPTPNKAYTLLYRYRRRLKALSPTNPIPYGGPEHAQTLLESCLMKAEEHKGQRGGQHSQAFLRNLAASVDYDKKSFSPKFLGFNNEGPHFRWRGYRHDELVSYTS